MMARQITIVLALSLVISPAFGSQPFGEPYGEAISRISSLDVEYDTHPKTNGTYLRMNYTVEIKNPSATNASIMLPDSCWWHLSVSGNNTDFVIVNNYHDENILYCTLGYEYEILTPGIHTYSQLSAINLGEINQTFATEQNYRFEVGVFCFSSQISCYNATFYSDLKKTIEYDAVDNWYPQTTSTMITSTPIQSNNSNADNPFLSSFGNTHVILFVAIIAVSASFILVEKYFIQ